MVSIYCEPSERKYAYIPCDHEPWNAWKVDEETGLRTHETGGWIWVLRHLLRCRTCRRMNRVTRAWVREQIRYVEGEWRFVAGYDC